MFNLNQAVANWRRQLVSKGIKSPEALDELESHLRDGIEAQLGCGLDTEQAFELAVQRLGAPAELSREYAKSGQPHAAPRPTFLRCFYFLCATGVVLIDLWTLVSFELSAAERVGAAFVVALFALYLFGLPFFSWAGRRASCGWYPGLMKAAGFLVPVWVVWALLTALRLLNGQIGILSEMFMWSVCAIYGLTVLAWTLNQGAGRPGGSGGGLLSQSLVPKPIPPSPPCPPDFGIRVPSSAALAPAARQALEVAREEALALGHDFVGTEHLLLGVLKTAGAALAQLLQSSRVDIQAVRGEVHRLITAWPALPAGTVLPLTPRARKALQFAGREAAVRERSPIEAEHILLGLLREGTGIGALALTNLGIRLNRLRGELFQQ